MPLDKTRLPELRAAAHQLTPSVKVGADGVTPGVIAALEAAFKKDELVKLQCGKAAPHAVDAAAAALSKATQAEIVQVIGRRFTLWREKGSGPASKAAAAPRKRPFVPKPAR